MKPLYVKSGTTLEEIQEMSLIHQQSCFEEYIDDLLTQAQQDTAQAVLAEQTRILKVLQNVEDLSQDEEKKKWAEHCSCLRYAIDVIKNPEAERTCYASTDQLAPSEQRSEEHETNERT